MILLVLAHPNPQSFNAAIARRCRAAMEGAGHEVVFHDLYAEGFDAMLPAAEFPRNA
ncbi:MAG: NAD(P)H-dependent oxidoreductase, partial [Oceanidesulfovibrio sp.]